MSHEYLWALGRHRAKTQSWGRQYFDHFTQVTLLCKAFRFRRCALASLLMRNLTKLQYRNTVDCENLVFIPTDCRENPLPPRVGGSTEQGSVIYVGLSSRPKDVIYRTEAERMYSNERHKERKKGRRPRGLGASWTMRRRRRGDWRGRGKKWNVNGKEEQNKGGLVKRQPTSV